MKPLEVDGKLRLPYLAINVIQHWWKRSFWRRHELIFKGNKTVDFMEVKRHFRVSVWKIKPANPSEKHQSYNYLMTCYEETPQEVL